MRDIIPTSEEDKLIFLSAVAPFLLFPINPPPATQRPLLRNCRKNDVSQQRMSRRTRLSFFHSRLDKITPKSHRWCIERDPPFFSILLRVDVHMEHPDNLDLVLQ